MMFASPRAKLPWSDGAYWLMIDVASFEPARFGCVVLLTRYDVEITPSTFAPLAAAERRNSRFSETLLMNVAGGPQPTFVAVTSAVIVGVGVAKTTNVSAPLLFSARICCVRLGFVTSYDSASTMLLFLAPSPPRSPA